MQIDVKKFDFLSNRILSSLSSKERMLFMEYTRKLYFKKGKQIFYEGGLATGVFLIERGKAKIFKTGVAGKDQIFYVYKSGDLMGYHSLLCGEPYEDSCEALEECTVFFTSKDKFNELLNMIPDLKLLIIQNMSHEFGVMVNTITVLAQKSMRQRLALYLLILQQKYEDNDGKILLSRKDLANIVGMARESLGRLLKDFREEKLILINQKSIELVNYAKLQKVADS
ncbi:MAG: CRP-like cAMP-binding protein [Cyclobacteriaceae bacterium]|jgi:CRP-like cAMP-binding protein